MFLMINEMHGGIAMMDRCFWRKEHVALGAVGRSTA
jgi:hypothetical protein